MIDWKARQRNCQTCHSLGYHHYGALGIKDTSRATRCNCQPQTLPELTEAVMQEREASAQLNRDERTPGKAGA